VPGTADGERFGFELSGDAAGQAADVFPVPGGAEHDNRGGGAFEQLRDLVKVAQPEFEDLLAQPDDVLGFAARDVPAVSRRLGGRADLVQLRRQVVEPGGELVDRRLVVRRTEPP
jgi:hypothetical protein